MTRNEIKKSDTKTEILRIARNYLQNLGYHSLSFQMIADELGIRKPSLYHHFPSKEDLGLAVIQQYAAWFERWIEKVKDEEPQKKLHKYFEIFEEFSADDAKLCPIGALSIDINSLPTPMRKALKDLCELHLSWLKQVLKENIRDKKIKTSLDLTALTDMVMSTLQGALVISRVKQERKSFALIRKNLESLLGGAYAR